MALIDGIKKWVNGTEEDDDFEEFIPRNRDIKDEFAQPETKKNKVVNINATAQLAVVLVKPERFENAAEIADNLKAKKTVLLNLEQADKDVARRLIDFLSGVAYANEGKIKRAAHNTFVITPYNVELSGDLMDELENSGLYM